MARRFSSFILLLLLLLLSHAPAQAQLRQRCVICGDEIRGTYWRAEGKVYCGRCYSTLPRCDSCGLPTKAFTPVDGRKACPSCIARLPRCSVCARPAIQYWEIEGKKYCGECGKSVVGNCDLCGALLRGESWVVKSTLDGEGQRCCASCMRAARKCDLCSFRLPSATPPCTDGRYFCRKCLSTLVTDSAQLAAIYSEVLENLATRLGIGLRQRPEFHPVGPAEFIARVGNRPGYEKGESLGLFTCAKSKSRSGDVIIKDPAIYILFPLPFNASYWTVAHETGHGWYEENTKDVCRDKKIVEGFAEWVAFRMLTLKGILKEPAFMASRQDLYGEGLRFFLEKEKRAGARGVLDWVKTL